MESDTGNLLAIKTGTPRQEKQAGSRLVIIREIVYKNYPIRRLLRIGGVDRSRS